MFFCVLVAMWWRHLEMIFLQCSPEQLSKDLHEELMCQLDHDHSLQKVIDLQGTH